MSHKDVLRIVARHELPVVLVGGLALRILGDPGAAPVMALAIRALDVEPITGLLYQTGYKVVTTSSASRVHLLPTATRAIDWIEETGTSSATLVQADNVDGLGDLPVERVQTDTQVDLVFDLPVPIMRLRARARTFALDDIELRVACAEDLLELRRRRPRITLSERREMAFLQGLISSSRSSDNRG
jgi:hypothetical protein